MSGCLLPVTREGRGKSIDAKALMTQRRKERLNPTFHTLLGLIPWIFPERESVGWM